MLLNTVVNWTVLMDDSRFIAVLNILWINTALISITLVLAMAVTFEMSF